MAIKRNLKINEKTVEVNELSVSQVRDWIKESASKRIDDPVDYLLFDDFVVSELTCFTNLNAAEIEELTPRELRLVVDAVKEVNPHFFELTTKLAAMGREYMKKLQSESGN